MTAAGPLRGRTLWIMIGSGLIAGWVTSVLLCLTIGRCRYTADFKSMASPEKAI